MRIKSILISIVIAATAGMWCACNDDLDLGVNDAKLEKVEGFRISKFTTDRLNWAIDNGADIRIVFHSNADDALYEFSMTVDNSGSKPVYAIHIPEKQTIPDGEYDALAFLGNGKAICPRMKFKIIKEIVEEIQAREGKFRLPGHGTQEKPYIIGSKEAFNEFEIGLCEDGNSKGFGLFFEQTAVDNSGSKPVYAIHIPEKQTIPDGEYDALAFLGNGKAICPRMKFKIIKEIVEEIQAREGKFRLPGHGTQEKPYIIGSKEAFNEFEIGLCEDGNSKGFGLFFEQTASFDVPPRSQIITGTYHACESFAGNYQGNGFTLTVPYTGSTSEPNDCEIGLFKELVGGAVIHNLTINAMIQGVHSNGGALAGKSSGKVMIDSVNIEGSINAQNRYNIGGFIGYATGELTISNSSIMAFVAGEDAIGGAVGLFKDGSLTISKFYNAKVDKNKRGDESRSYMPFSVTASANNAGGLVGRVDGSTTNISISDVTMVRSVQAEDGNLKAVSVVSENAGGLIGGLFNFKSCQFRNVSLNFPVYGGDSTGGLAGYTSMGGDMSIENCRFFSVASGNNSVGGLFGTVRGHSHSIAVEGSDDGTSVKQDANSLVKISGKLNVGGFAGHIDDTKLTGKRIYINAPVSATDTNAGCAIGNVTNATVNLSLFNISKYAKATGPQNIGGMVGSADNSTLTGSLNIGTLSNYTSIPKASTFTPTFSGFAGTSGITKNVGGIVGYIKNSFVTNLCFAGTVEGCNNVGGIIGLADNIDKGYVRGCVNNSPKIDNKISDSTGGIIGRLNQFDCATCENLINYGEISGANYTGGIIGDIHEEGKAKNFYLKNAVNVGKVTGTGQVGGCVGHYWASGILNLGIETIHYILYCANYGEVNGSNGGNVGGIIGYFNARKAVVSHSANHGKVYGSGNDVKVGGIAGRMGSNDEAGTALPNNMELSYSCNFGEVGSNTGNANVGGLLGWQEQGSPDDETHYMLHNCYNMGIVPTNQDSDNGGVLGCIDHLGEVQNCYNAKKVSHGNGIIGTHKGGSIFYHHNLYVLEDSGKYWCADKFKESDKSKESTYKGFDFKSVWAVSTSTNNGFPYLRDCPYQFKKLE